MVSRRASAILRSLLVATSLGLVAAGPVSADHEPARLGLTPVGRDATFFELTMQPGDSAELQVEAANFGHEEADARTYAADVYSIVNGGFGADLFGERSAGTTLWVSYSTQELTLGPEDAVVIDFEVSVPESTEPGEYITALVIENAEPVVGSGGIAFDQVNRSAIAIAITVPGPQRPGLEIGELRLQEVAGISVITFEVANTGNVHLHPTGDFALHQGADTEVAAAPVTMGTVYAGTSTRLEAPVGELLPPGGYCAELRLTDQSTGASATTECIAFEVAVPVDEGPQAGGPLPEIAAPVIAAFRDSPLTVTAVALFAAAGAVFLVIWRRRRAAPVLDGTGRTLPAADQPAPVRETPAETVGRVMGTVRKALRAEPRVHRAWIIERRAGFVLAIETQPGTAPAEGARVAREIQEFTDEALHHAMPLQVEHVNGDRPVASTTADVVPFYVNAGDSPDVVN
jgi:hypothetical protein